MISNSLKVYCAQNYVDCVVTNPYHHQANFQVERLNRSLVQMHSKMTYDEPKDKWD